MDENAKEKAIFFTTINRALRRLTMEGQCDICEDCNGSGELYFRATSKMPAKTIPCPACGSFGSQIEGVLRRMRHDKNDDGAAFQDAIATMQETFCPEDKTTAWSLSACTELLNGADAQATAAWMFANLAAIMRRHPELAESDMVHSWAMGLSDELQALSDDDDNDLPSVGEA